ncbi:MAG TPA: hypothetical protein VGV38_17795 [Pyrinomonadaceae bacterium]|nr:hypothetical protein [Pyrinomonadaceae bacterium]
MEAELADYVLCLNECLARTRHAGDRPLYEKYLADAAVLLALAVRGASSEELRSAAAAHGRLLDQTWLEGPEGETVRRAWEHFRSLL